MSCLFFWSDSMAVRSRSIVACRRSVVEACKAASCVSEGARNVRRFRGLAFMLVACLRLSEGGWKDFKHRHIATGGFLRNLHAHNVDHIIEQLHLDARLASINGIALRFKAFCLLGIGLTPCKGCSQFFRIFHMVAATQTQGPIIAARAQSWTATVA